MKNNKCAYCGKELKSIVVRHHINQNMKYECPKRYSEYRDEDIVLLCSVVCHTKIHRIKIYNLNGNVFSIYDLERIYNKKNIKSRIYMAQERDQKYFKIKGDMYIVPPRNKPYNVKKDISKS